MIFARKQYLFQQLKCNANYLNCLSSFWLIAVTYHYLQAKKCAQSFIQDRFLKKILHAKLNLLASLYLSLEFRDIFEECYLGSGTLQTRNRLSLVDQEERTQLVNSKLLFCLFSGCYLSPKIQDLKLQPIAKSGLRF